jgi:hypothetical protein
MIPESRMVRGNAGIDDRPGEVLASDAEEPVGRVCLDRANALVDALGIGELSLTVEENPADQGPWRLRVRIIPLGRLRGRAAQIGAQIRLAQASQDIERERRDPRSCDDVGLALSQSR